MKRRKHPLTVFDTCNVLVMIAFTFLCLYPFVYVAVLSFNDGIDAQRGGIYFWPRIVTMENYVAIFQDKSVLSAYAITLFRVVVGTTTSVLLTAACSYAMQRPMLPFRKAFNWMIVLPLYFSGGLIPYYMVIKTLGLRDNLLVYIIPALFSPFNIILVRTFVKQLHEAMFESAKLDGANEWTIFTRIIFPLLGPVLATISLFIAVGHWNDWFTGTIYMSRKDLWPASTLLLHILQSSEISTYVNPKMFTTGALARKRTVTPEAIKMAMLMVTTLPIVLAYPFLQRYFVKGVMVGSLKG